jgi:choline kinase
MKAVILAAGSGTRLGKHAKGKPKTLVEIAGTPILDFTLKNLLGEGIEDVVIVTGYKGNKIKEFINKKYHRLNVSYVHNNIYDRTNNIYSIYLAKKKLINSNFLLINSDVLFHEGILRSLWRNEGEVVLSVDMHVKLAEEEMKVRIEGELIVEISKEIPAEDADGEYVGLTKVDRDISEAFFECVEKTIKEKGHRVFYEEAFQRMIDEDYSIRYETTKGLPWIEIDTSEDLKIAQEIIAPRIMAKSLWRSTRFL